MERIREAGSNLNSSDDELALDIGYHSDWWIEDDQIFDSEERHLASVQELAKAARKAGWFMPAGTRVTGVSWSALPHGSVERAAQIRRLL